MFLGLLPLTYSVLLANALVSQQIIFNSHLELTTGNNIVDPVDLRFSPNDAYPLQPNDAVVKTRPTTVYRPRSLDALQNARFRSMRVGESPNEPLEWDAREVQGPDIEDRHTLAQLARMSGNAYALPGRYNWYDVDHAWNRVCLSLELLMCDLS
jgi:lipase ATG15